MTREEMIKRMEELEKQMFNLEMKDRWDSKDYALKKQLFKEYLELEAKVKALN